MMFSRSFLVALISAPLLAFAAGPNQFNNPPDFSAKAGVPVTLSWDATTPGTISLYLRSGASSDLEAGSVIVSGIKNSGSYTWTPSASTLTGTDYTIEIVDDADTSMVNYTPYFYLDTPTTVAPATTSQISAGAPTSSLPLSTFAPSSVATTSSASSSSASSSSSGGSTTSSASTTMTTSVSPSQSSAANAAVFTGSSTSTHSGAAHRATAMAGLLGAVALGALAL